MNLLVNTGTEYAFITIVKKHLITQGASYHYYNIGYLLNR